ncbi:MAG: EF-hand domain-containing protein [Syntrophorhabdaceae bacterium]
MKKIIILIVFFLIVMFLTWNVYAGPDSFGKVDSNKDGIISQQEFNTAVKAKFNEYDADKDGRIDAQEFAANGPPEAVKEFKFMDRSNDGFVNSDEFYKAALQRRDDFDFNRDGKISKQEYNSNKALPFLKFYF